MRGARTAWPESRRPSADTLVRRPRRGAGVVERGGLESRWSRKRLEGSNPSPSAHYAGRGPASQWVLLRAGGLSPRVSTAPLAHALDALGAPGYVSTGLRPLGAQPGTASNDRAGAA